jgi:tetratricopeptide (TPR) repeat protein
MNSRNPRPSAETLRRAVLALVAAACVFVSPRVFAQAPADDRTLVMPFENVERLGKIYWVSEASSVLLGEDLAAYGARTIPREERLKAFERLSLPPVASLTDATIIKVAQLVGAGEVVHGSLTLSGEELTVAAKRIRLDTGRLQAEIVEHGRLDDLFRIFDRVAARLMGASGEPKHRGDEHGPLVAFENYIKGLLAGTPAGQVKFLQAALAQYQSYDAARLALWQAYNAQGDHKQALATALPVPEASRSYRRARFLASLSQIQLRQYDAATMTLQALITQAPLAVAFNNLGVVQLRRGSTTQGAGSASSYFNKARETDRDDPDYEFNLGYACFVERDPQAAVYWLREAVRSNPADGDAHYVLGAALLSTGATAEGAREKELALRLSSVYEEWAKRPANDPVPRGLERLKEDLEPPRAGRPDLAFVTAEQRDQRDLATFHLDRGRRLFQQENDNEAIAELSRALYLQPYQAEAHLLLGQIYLRTGRLREAIDALKISLWSEETARGHLALAEVYLQAKDLAAAKTEAQRALAMDPQLSEARKLLEKIGG